MTSTPPIGVALIGSGIFARTEHLPAILANPRLSLKAVYSRTLASASALTAHLETKIDWYSEETASLPPRDGTTPSTPVTPPRGYADLLSNTNIKAVIIALPITVQPRFIKEALQAGKHVLSEKPIGPDVNGAQELLRWYNDIGREKRGTWCVAENWRWLESHDFAKEKVKELGRVLGFRVRVQSMVKPGSKYYETQWRKEPAYQGGFLLDGAVHFIANIRHLLGPSNRIVRASAFTSQLQPHLPPVDTVNAILQTETGISGTFAVSFGTTFKGSGYSIACDGGTVTVLRDTVVVEKNGQEEKWELGNIVAGEKSLSGVMQESKAWTEGIEAGGVFDRRLSPEEALVDLAVLEAMLRSGENMGSPYDVQI